jgi:hypothetical protein
MTGNTKIVAFGIVRWVVRDVEENERILRVPAFYLPSSDIRLLSPQSYANFRGWGKRELDCFGGNKTRVWLELNVDCHTMARMEANIASHDNLPYFFSSPVPSTPKSTTEQPPKPTSPCDCTSCIACHFTAVHNMEVLSKRNQNLSPAQKELLLDHQRLGHLNMAHVQQLYRDRDVTHDFDGSSKSGA